MKTLSEYRQKRDFDRTGEPSGSGRAKSGRALRFVVQYHIASRVHYDFRLEWKGVLLSWAVPKGPSYNPRDKRLAIMVEDHPVEYADFEGLIPKGQYGGGTVMLWDEGTWEPQFDAAEGLAEGSLKIVLHGARLQGKWALVRLKEQESEDKQNWLLIKENDEFARDEEGISAWQTSVRSGRTIAQINGEEDLSARKNPFRRADVQLAELVDSVPKKGKWLYEVKYDGYRILAFVEKGRARFATRNDNDFTQKFANVAETLGAWSEGRAMVLDGEMVVPDEEGKTSFQALQHAAKEGGEDSLVYMVFDLLALDGEDLRALPLVERKRRLAALCRKTPPCLSLSNHVEGKGEESLAAAQRMGLEGIVGKLADSPYRGERSGDWIKIKCYRRQEFVLGGYTRSGKNTSGVSALLLGVYKDGSLVYAGRAGTGIGQSEADELLKAFDKLGADTCPFAGVPRARADEERFWLRPQLVAEVQFAEWTGEDVLRQASFKGLRADKDPTQVVREEPSAAPGEAAKSAAKKSAPKQSAKVAAAKSAKPAAAKKSAAEKTAVKKPAAAGRRRTEKEVVPPQVRRAMPPPVGAVVCGVPISNPDKLVYTTPEVRKIDLVRYYERVAARMLPFAANRVLSVVRCHKGVDAACYFKKHPSAESAGVVVIPIENKEGEESDYFYLEDARGLIAEAQLGTIEFHVWGSRVETLEQPDMMVFDLDPDAGMPLEQVRQGVRDLKSVLDKLSLQSFLKVSGGKGYHVVVPFRPAVSWEVFHDFARRVAEVMEQQWPDRYTANMRKEKRQGKIFIDWVRNGRGATSVAPYSLRARPGARVSMPVAWRELDTVAPDGIDLEEALRRLRRSDPWKDFYAVDQQLQ